MHFNTLCPIPAGQLTARAVAFLGQFFIKTQCSNHDVPKDLTMKMRLKGAANSGETMEKQ